MIKAQLGGTTLLRKTINNARLLMANNDSYLFLDTEPTSRYQGFFIYEGTMHKVIEDIVSPGTLTAITDKLNCAERKRTATERFFLPLGAKSLVYELNASQRIELILDVRKSYDSRQWGRSYTLSEEAGCLLITFSKKTDGREDDSDGQEEFTVYLAIKGHTNCNKIEQWVEHRYSDDEQRNAPPFTRFVFAAVALTGKHFVFSASKDKKKALQECTTLFHGTHCPHRAKITAIKDKNIAVAYTSALSSLYQLTRKDGIIAGLPWFFQVWPRDELISLNALRYLKKDTEAKRIIKKYILSMSKGGTLPNNVTDGSIRSADALGWLFKRIDDYQFNPTKKETTSIERTVKNLVAHSTNEELSISGHKETWMDSIDRSGARIEIQALRLLMYATLFRLTKKEQYRRLETTQKKKIMKTFWNGSYLNDGVDDPTMRPNIFIAHYVYPRLLTKKQWTSCFEHALKKLWLPWGGLATIDTSHEAFHPHHTGEHPASYHNGDSWFWINNLAALCMHRLDKKKFKKYVGKIIKASTQEILWHGCLGHHAELSSASSFISQGSPVQAWSAAMYIELVNEMYKV